MAIKSAYQQALDIAKSKIGSFIKGPTAVVSVQPIGKIQPNVAQQNFNKTFSRDYSNWQSQQKLTQQKQNTSLVDTFKNIGNYFNPTKDTNPSTSKVDNFWTAKAPVGLDRLASTAKYGQQAIKSNYKQQAGFLLKNPKGIVDTAKYINTKIPNSVKNVVSMINPQYGTLRSVNNLTGNLGEKVVSAGVNKIDQIGNKMMISGAKEKEKIQLEKEKKVGITPQHSTFLENIKDPRYVGDMLGMQAPQMISDLGLQTAIAFATKGTSLPAQFGLSLAPLYAASGNEAYNDIKANNPDMDDNTAMQIAGGVGIISGLLDKVGLDSILGKLGNKAGESIVKEVKGTLVKNILKRLGNVATTATIEGTTEGLQQTVLNAAAKLFYDHQRDWLDQVPENAFFGFIMGGLAKFGVEIPQEKLMEIQKNNQEKSISSKILGAKAPDYNNSADFAEAEFGATPETQVGFYDSKNIIPPENINKERVGRYAYMINQGGMTLDPVEVTTNEQGKLIATDQNSAERLAAYQAVGAPVPIINRSNVKLPELSTAEELYADNNYETKKEETVQSLATEEMKNFNPDNKQQIKDLGDNSTEPVGTEFDLDSGKGMAVIKSILSNKQLEDLQVITAGKDDIINPETGEIAWGKYYDSIITVVEQNGKIQSGTLYHEAFHYYADKLADKELYTSALKEAKDQGLTLDGKEYNDPSEYLADGFAQFIQGRTNFSGKVLAFFQDLLVAVRSMMGKANAVEMLYYNAVKGSAPANQANAQLSPAYRNTEMLQSPEQEYRMADRNANIFFSQERTDPNEVGFEDIKTAMANGDHTTVSQLTQQISNEFDKMFFPDATLDNQLVLGIYFGSVEGSNRIVVRRPEDMNVGLYKSLVFAKYNHQDSVFTQDFSEEIHPNLHLTFNQQLSPEQQMQLSSDISTLSNEKFAGASIIPGENRVQISYVPEYSEFSTDIAVDTMESLVLQLKDKGYQFDFDFDSSKNGLIFNQDYDSRISQLSSKDSRIQGAIESSRNQPDFRGSMESNFAAKGHILSNPDQFWSSITGTTGPQYRVADTKTSEEVKPITQEDVDNFDSQEYVKEEEARREAEHTAGTKPATIVDKISKAIKTIRYGLVDSFSPIEDVLDWTERKFKFKILPTKDIRYQLDRVLRFGTIADQFAKDNGLVNVVQEAPDIDVMNQYLIARHAQDLEKLGYTTGRDSRKDALLVEQLKGSEYQKLAEEQVDTYRVKLLDYMVATGLTNEYIKDLLINKYPHYVPSQRVFDDIETSKGKFLSPKQVASIAEQTIIKELKGSERAIEDPLAQMFLQTRSAFEQGERNRAASMLASYKDLPGNPFDITPLRVAEDVLKRIDLLSEAKELGSIKNPLERILKTRKGWLRGLMTELNSLNKKGMQISLKPNKDGEFSVDLTTKLETDTIPNVEFGNGDLRDSILWMNGNPGPESDYHLIESKMGNREVKQIINNLIKLDKPGLNLIRKKIAGRDVKLNNLISEVENIKTEIDNINAKRSELLDEAHLLKEAESKGKAIISTLKDGIKEIYEIDPDIEKASKSMDKAHIEGFAKILNKFTRILQLGATGINLPFVVFNVVKDQMTAAINSDHALQTSLANPANFVNALGAAVKHDGLFNDWNRAGASGTMFDISRDNPVQSLESVRARKNLKSKIAYVVTHPDAYIPTLENIIGRGEELTRIQQFSGMKNQLMAEGRTEADATILAANASRFNTANFSRGGTFAKMANYYVPFLNAGIQGSRSFGRALLTRPAPTIFKLATLIYMPMAAATLWNTGDEERKKAYEDIQEWEKEDNFIFIPEHPTKNEKGQWNVIKMPLPPGLSNVASLVRRPLEQLAGQDPVTAKEIFDDLIQAGTSFDVSSPMTMLNNLPQVFRPLVEVGTNKDLFTGGDIVPSYMKTWDKQDQVQSYTSGTARAIGQALGMSPIMVEKEISTLGGGAAKQVLNAVDTGLNTIGLIPKEQVGGESVVGNIINRTTKARGGDIANDIYTITDELANQKRGDKAAIVSAINNEITPDINNIQKAVSGLDKEEANSAIDKAFNDKLRSAMDSTEKAIQSSTKEEREALAVKRPDLISTINVVNEKEAISKIQSKITKATLVAPDVLGLSDTAAAKVKRSNDFKVIHDLEDSVRELGLPTSALASEYARYGIDPEDSVYDKLTTLPDDIQLDEIKSQISGLQGDDLLTTLISMRAVSEGTRKSLLTDALVNDLVDEGIVSKNEGKLLTSLVWNSKTNKFEKKKDTGSAKKISIPKITLSKIDYKMPSLGGGIKTSSSSFAPLKLATAKFTAPPSMTIKKPGRISTSALLSNMRSQNKNISGLGRIG